MWTIGLGFLIRTDGNGESKDFQLPLLDESAATLAVGN